MPANSALTTAGAQLFLSSNWSLLAKFEGEFAHGSQTYAGSGTLRVIRGEDLAGFHSSVSQIQLVR